ncbi:MAG: zf-HC2 domain-containing protein [Candidatus Aminicenantes bacterium]|nr:zf-HC2 domain-containing protein [Candidatus Aminicenantes bacterium]
MRCQDVERLMLESSEGEWTLEEQRVLEAHLESCPDCAAFRDFREGLRVAQEKAPVPELDADLAEKVRLRCHAELDTKAARRPAGVPWSIWAAFGILIVITVGFFIPQIQEFFTTKEFTPAIGLLLVIILQNAVMLFFAPVVMRRQRIDRHDWRECR